MNKKFFIFMSIMGYLTLIVAIGIILMMTIPVKVLEFQNEEFPITNKIVKAGGVLEYRAQFYKNRDLPVVISKQLINSYIYNYTPAIGQLSIGYTDKLVQIELPKYIEPGEYYIRIIYEYKVNPFRTEKFIHDTEEFQVIE